MMGRSALRLGLEGFSGIVTVWFAAASVCTSEGYARSRGQYWATDWAAKPVNSLVADVDGDGRADLIAFDPRGDASLWAGAAVMMSDKGGFGTSTEPHDMMSHELGHELGLNHDGYQTHNSPIYPSLMSYTYQNTTYVFAGGRYWVENRIEAVATPWAEQTVSINVRNGPRFGWLHRRYYSPGEFDSRSAPGVCWFRDDIAYANRLHSSDPDRNDRLLLGFNASGAFDTMTDFNDFAFIAEIGLSHSLMTVSE